MAVIDQRRVTLLNVSAHGFLGRPLLPLPIFASHKDVACADLCWSILATWIIRDAVREITTLSGSLSPRHGASSEERTPISRVAANILNKQSRTVDRW